MADIAVRGISDSVHQALKSAAARNNRSLNGEIVHRLEASVEATPLDVESLRARVAERRARWSGGDLDESALRRLRDTGRP